MTKYEDIYLNSKHDFEESYNDLKSTLQGLKESNISLSMDETEKQEIQKGIAEIELKVDEKTNILNIEQEYVMKDLERQISISESHGNNLADTLKTLNTTLDSLSTSYEIGKDKLIETKKEILEGMKAQEELGNIGLDAKNSPELNSEEKYPLKSVITNIKNNLESNFDKAIEFAIKTGENLKKFARNRLSDLNLANDEFRYQTNGMVSTIQTDKIKSCIEFINKYQTEIEKNNKLMDKAILSPVKTYLKFRNKKVEALIESYKEDIERCCTKINKILKQNELIADKWVEIKPDYEGFKHDVLYKELSNLIKKHENLIPAKFIEEQRYREYESKVREKVENHYTLEDAFNGVKPEKTPENKEKNTPVKENQYDER